MRVSAGQARVARTTPDAIGVRLWDNSGVQIKTAPTGALTPNAGASPTVKESTDG